MLDYEYGYLYLYIYLAKPSCYTWPARRYSLCCPAWQLVLLYFTKRIKFIIRILDFDVVKTITKIQLSVIVV